MPMVDYENALRLLEELYTNSRTHANALTAQLGLSRQTISKLRADFWEKRVINSAELLINPHVLNIQFFFMEIKTNPSEPHVLDYFTDIEAVTSLDGILGENSLIARFEVPSKKRFAQILDQIDQNIAKTQFSSYRIMECIDIYKLGGFTLERGPASHPLDENDKKWHLLQLLRRNYNLRRWPDRGGEHTFSPEEEEYLNKINISREYSQFQSDQIIQAFTISINTKRLRKYINKSGTPNFEPELDTKFYVKIKPRQIGQYTLLAEELVHNPNIIDLYRTGDEAGLLALVRTRGLDGYNAFIKEIYQQYEVADTHTTVVVDEIIPTIYPPTLGAAKRLCACPQK